MRQVLVVDDEDAITEGLLALFELEHIDAMCANDRESAEALIAAEFYPVILADLRLRTEADGLELLSSIQRISPRSRVASLTAFATPEIEAELLRRGSSMVLRKPMEFDEIIAVVEEMLREITLEAEAQQARTGQPLDTAALYQDVHRVLYSIPQKRFGFSADESAELVQEAWCLFMQKQASIQMARPWLAGTVANLCKQQIHSLTRRRETTKQMSAETVEIVGSHGASYDKTLMVRQALEQLDDRARKLCVLIGMEGWSYDEVSEELDLPLGSVGPLYIRAKAKMRKLLNASSN